MKVIRHLARISKSKRTVMTLAIYCWLKTDIFSISCSWLKFYFGSKTISFHGLIARYNEKCQLNYVFFTEVTICFFCRENQFYCEREVVTRYCSIYNNLHVRFTNKITSGPSVINDSFNVILFTSVEIFESLILLNFEIWTELGHWVIKCKISLVVNFLPKIINFDPDTWCGGAELRVTVGQIFHQEVWVVSPVLPVPILKPYEGWTRCEGLLDCPEWSWGRNNYRSTCRHW